jgi:hypothetical protein
MCVLPSVAETATGVESADAMTGVTWVGAGAVWEATSEDDPAHKTTTNAPAIVLASTEALLRVLTVSHPTVASAWSRSALMSSMCSMPIDSRT